MTPPSASAPTPRTPRTPRCPSLPPEIWIRILTFHTDLAHLWTTCRLVSPTFLAYTEQVFAESVLRYTVRIAFQLEKYNLGGKTRRPEIPTTFHRLSRDREKKIVYFRDGREKGVVGDEKEVERVVQRWGEQVRGSKPEIPHYTVEIGDVVNDTELPGLGFDEEKREICFEWRGMLRAFYREEERLRRLKGKWERDRAMELEKRRVEAEAASEDSDGPAAPTALRPSWNFAVEKEFRKEIRRTRLKEHYKGNEEMLWALDSLEFLETNNQQIKVIPGTQLGEKFFRVAYLPPCLLLDEWSSLHRIDAKMEEVKSGKRQEARNRKEELKSREREEAKSKKGN